MSHLHPHTGVSCAPSCYRFFSAQLSFPSRWLKAQPNLFIHSSKTQGGRALWGSGSPLGGGLLAPHWLFLSAGTQTVPRVSRCCATGTPEWAQGPGKAFPCAVATESSDGTGEGARPVSPALSVGLPPVLLRTDLPSYSPTLPSGPSH